MTFQTNFHRTIGTFSMVIKTQYLQQQQQQQQKKNAFLCAHHFAMLINESNLELKTS